MSNSRSGSSSSSAEPLEELNSKIILNQSTDAIRSSTKTISKTICVKQTEISKPKSGLSQSSGSEAININIIKPFNAEKVDLSMSCNSFFMRGIGSPETYTESRVRQESRKRMLAEAHNQAPSLPITITERNDQEYQEYQGITEIEIHEVSNDEKDQEIPEIQVHETSEEKKTPEKKKNKSRSSLVVNLLTVIKSSGSSSSSCEGPDRTSDEENEMLFNFTYY